MKTRDCKICGEILTAYGDILFCKKCDQFFRPDKDKKLVKMKLKAEGNVYWENQLSF